MVREQEEDKAEQGKKTRREEKAMMTRNKQKIEKGMMMREVRVVKDQAENLLIMKPNNTTNLILLIADMMIGQLY